jgi:hypothetical protein
MMRKESVDMTQSAIRTVTTFIVAAIISFAGLMAINIALFLTLRSQIPQTPLRTPSTL